MPRKVSWKIKSSFLSFFYGTQTQIINHFASHNPLIQSEANVLCMMLFNVINKGKSASLRPKRRNHT